MNNGLTLLTNITWAKVIDNTSSATEGNTGPPNPFNLQSGRGPADFDQAIRFNLSAVYVTPHINVTGFRSALLNNWQLNGIASIQSGLPFTVLSGTDRSLSGIGNDYADIAGNPARPAGVNKIKEYFNTAAFVPAATGTFGDISRNSLRGPGYADVDLGSSRAFTRKSDSTLSSSPRHSMPSTASTSQTRCPLFLQGRTGRSPVRQTVPALRE